MRKKFIAGVFLLMITVSSFGCSNKTTTTLTEEEQSKIKTEILEYSVNGGDNIQELDGIIKNHIHLFPQKDKDEIIDTYVKNMFAFIDDLNTKLSTVGYELEDTVQEYKINLLDSSTFRKIPNSHGTVRGFLEELHDRGFVLESDNDNKNYYISIDIQSVLDKYGSDMSDSLKKYLEFNAYEIEHKDFIDTDTESIDLDEVSNRIIMLEDGIKIDKKQDYAFIDKWTASLEYYYTLLFNLSHDYFIDDDNKFTEEILSKYKELSSKYKDTKMATDIQLALNILNKNDNKLDETVKEKLTGLVDGIYTKKIQQAIDEKYPENALIEDE